LARRRQRYAASPELRESSAETRRRTKRKPDIREKLKEYFKVLRQKQSLLGNKSRKQIRQPDLMGRRAILLRSIIYRPQWSKQRWTWKSHAPVLEKDRVDHTCTSCGRIRFLKLWWKEKLPGKATDANSGDFGFLCCFG
jgi:hypothetical protein